MHLHHDVRLCGRTEATGGIKITEQNLLLLVVMYKHDTHIMVWQYGMWPYAAIQTTTTLKMYAQACHNDTSSCSGSPCMSWIDLHIPCGISNLPPTPAPTYPRTWSCLFDCNTCRRVQIRPWACQTGQSCLHCPRKPAGCCTAGLGCRWR